jgi:hypothetical protein
MVYKGDVMPAPEPTDDALNTLLNGLQGINRYLALINSRIEPLLLSDLPDYVMADLIKVYQAEAEASQIVRSLTIHCHKTV